MVGIVDVSKTAQQTRQIVYLAVTKAGNVHKLSESVGIFESSIGRWLSGKSNPNRTSIAKLRAYIDLDRID